MLADFNGKCGIRDVAKFEFDDFFSLLMNPTPSIPRHSMDVLEHPIFWPEQLRIAFIKALDDFLVANQAINTNIQAFDGGINMLNGNIAVHELLQFHKRYIVNNQIRSLFLQYLPNNFQNVPNSDMTRLCIETLKNLYTHFLTMKQPYIQLQNDEDLQHAVQEVFPMHLCILIPFARQINFPYQIGEILNYLYS
ncbi:uncharacterized protein LOC111277280 [Durio zibethinus]|uniref:Uncharacterized protein LOC111277280 n=1 Tax=Durio zibethinus TaxID=66656 RepID=A0A6P5WV18_DURZI|nr:uncharacterized protein LOC111277280 [Durio zibethinus]XP_022719351.1 uncharacterized protein LOC111277280 [Durio zibethinus]